MKFLVNRRNSFGQPKAAAKVRMHFCPSCGSTVYWLPEGAPSLIGVGVGLFADPAFPPPSLSIFEQSKHEWVALDKNMKHFALMPDQE
ncbi:Uncharacterized conserved protein [Brucella intermedia]|nr:Uncharacterized conserved protein [Brucella intermedia]